MKKSVWKEGWFVVEKKRIGNIYMNTFRSQAEAIDACMNRLNAGQKVNLYFLNDHGFNIAQADPEYLNALNRADFLLNDGIGVKLGAKIWGIRLDQNLNGTDLIPKLLVLFQQRGGSVFLLGASKQAVRSAAERMEQNFPGLNIADYHHGYFRSPEDMVRRINASGASVLLVGMGMPLQEKFIEAHDQELKPMLRIAGGGYIDFASGLKPRAPKIMRRLNLEWLFRMILEPRRMWKRNVIGHLQFFITVLRLKFTKKK
jgi:N-acetylglucosaminyldiphosphoundecaprenol N-acetyl-beta-D-mannosaminyltransferase